MPCTPQCPRAWQNPKAGQMPTDSEEGECPEAALLSCSCAVLGMLPACCAHARSGLTGGCTAWSPLLPNSVSLCWCVGSTTGRCHNVRRGGQRGGGEQRRGGAASAACACGSPSQVSRGLVHPALSSCSWLPQCCRSPGALMACGSFFGGTLARAAGKAGPWRLARGTVTAMLLMLCASAAQHTLPLLAARPAPQEGRRRAGPGADAQGHGAAGADPQEAVGGGGGWGAAQVVGLGWCGMQASDVERCGAASAPPPPAAPCPWYPVPAWQALAPAVAAGRRSG